MADLFDSGFAWSDTVAEPATGIATDKKDAFPSIFDDLDDAVAPVAPVAESEGRRLERLLLQDRAPLVATPLATPKMPNLCAVERPGMSAVAAVASVAAWQAGVDLMRRARPTPICYHTYWPLLVQDARSFLALWAGDAIAAGWDTLDVFGGNPDPAHARYDRLGLLILLRGRPIQALDADTALVGAGADTNTFRRRQRGAGGVPVWQWIEGVRQ